MILQNGSIAGQDDFQREGLQNVEKSLFSEKNLIIGKNGSGKTSVLYH